MPRQMIIYKQLDYLLEASGQLSLSPSIYIYTMIIYIYKQNMIYIYRYKYIYIQYIHAYTNGIYLYNIDEFRGSTQTVL